MGLIKAGMGALGGTLADQWKEFFYCDSLDKDVLMVKGQKRTSRRSSNHGDDNIITNGSGIAVADGQCMLIVEQGRVVEVCAEPGEYTFDSSTEPSVFTGNFGDSLAATFQTVAKRFTYGGDTGKDQRVYYINTKELGEILYGTATPIPFRVVVSEERGYKLSVNIRCNGSFTYRICDPLLFYTNVCSNVSNQYDASELAPRLKSELMNALQPALATLSANKVQYYEIPAHTLEISEALNEQLSNIWRKKRGIEVFSFNINSLSIPEEQQKKITEWEENAMTTDPTTAAARLVGGQIDAMKTAAGNTAGAMTGFMGMGMAAGANGMNAQNLFAMGQQPAAPQQQPSAAGSWQCSCGATVTGKFCPECGSKKPEPKPAADSWTVQLRRYRHRQVLPGVRQAPPGGSRRLDLQLRRGEQRQVLLRVRQTHVPPVCLNISATSAAGNRLTPRTRPSSARSAAILSTKTTAAESAHNDRSRCGAGKDSLPRRL